MALSDADEKLAQIHADALAAAAQVIADQKAADAAKALRGSELSEADLAAHLESIDAACGASAPHPAVPLLLDLVKHVVSKLHRLQSA